MTFKSKKQEIALQRKQNKVDQQAGNWQRRDDLARQRTKGRQGRMNVRTARGQGARVAKGIGGAIVRGLNSKSLTSLARQSGQIAQSFKKGPSNVDLTYKK